MYVHEYEMLGLGERDQRARLPDETGRGPAKGETRDEHGSGRKDRGGLGEGQGELAVVADNAEALGQGEARVAVESRRLERSGYVQERGDEGGGRGDLGRRRQDKADDERPPARPRHALENSNPKRRGSAHRADVPKWVFYFVNSHKDIYV